MEARVVAGFPSLYVLERDEWDETGDRLMPVRLRVQNTVKSLIRAGNRLREEMLALFRFMRAEHFPQKLLQKGVELLFKSLEFSFDRVDAALCEEQVQNFYRVLSLVQREAKLEEAFRLCVDCYLSADESDEDYRSIRQEVLRYVDEHFTMIDSVEQVAAVFNYNYTYLSRMFKNVTGTTMVKYITVKRIELAKRLMQENPQLGITVVSEMVGYLDQHYFSRTFKTVTGISPSEYRKNLQKQITVEPDGK